MCIQHYIDPNVLPLLARQCPQRNYFLFVDDSLYLGVEIVSFSLYFSHSSSSLFEQSSMLQISILSSYISGQSAVPYLHLLQKILEVGGVPPVVRPDYMILLVEYNIL